MAIAFQAASAGIGGTATSGTITWPGSPAGQILLAVFGFEGVTSGPWITDTGPSAGWSRALYQAPSASGSGLEVWASGPWATANTTTFNFAASSTFVARGLVYTGQYQGNAVRTTTTQAWTGNNPNTPGVFAFANELLIACAAEILSSPGFGTPAPSGSTQRFDTNRSGFGTVEITAADLPVSADGTYGPFVWTASASPSTAKAATGVLAIRPPIALPGSGFLLEAPMPPILDLPDGYRVVWAALDPNTGADVSGVVVGDVSLFGTMLGTGAGGGGEPLGPFMLVPGPAA